MMVKNLFQIAESAAHAEITEMVAESRGVRVERIVSQGQSSPEHFWYDQPEDEWVAVLQGRAELEFESGTLLPLEPGDHCMIPAHEKHRVKSTCDQETTIWLAIFFSSTD